MAIMMIKQKLDQNYQINFLLIVFGRKERQENGKEEATYICDTV